MWGSEIHEWGPNFRLEYWTYSKKQMREYYLSPAGPQNRTLMLKLSKTQRIRWLQRSSYEPTEAGQTKSHTVTQVVVFPWAIWCIYKTTINKNINLTPLLSSLVLKDLSLPATDGLIGCDVPRKTRPFAPVRRATWFLHIYPPYLMPVCTLISNVSLTASFDLIWTETSSFGQKPILCVKGAGSDGYFSHVHIDTVGPLPPTDDYRFLLTYWHFHWLTNDCLYYWHIQCNSSQNFSPSLDFYVWVFWRSLPTEAHILSGNCSLIFSPWF